MISATSGIGFWYAHTRSAAPGTDQYDASPLKGQWVEVSEGVRRSVRTSSGGR
ncbi:hypothetical protein GCM10010329_51220 [Streptomyces spiroverticillatus]|nr:hypothetical protein GCM10010329_51220 [Streptomyces spiroverticillatus]